MKAAVLNGGITVTQVKTALVDGNSQECKILRRRPAARDLLTPYHAVANMKNTMRWFDE